MPDIRYILLLFVLSLLLTGPVQAAHEIELNRMDQLIQAEEGSGIKAVGRKSYAVGLLREMQLLGRKKPK